MFLFYFTGEDPRCAEVVKLKGCGSLGVAHFNGGLSDDYTFASVDETGSGFRFLGGAHDCVDDFAEYHDWVIVHGCWGGGCDWERGFVSEVVKSAGAISSFGLCEIGGIRVNPEVHVTGFEDKGGVGVGCGIVEEVLNALFEIGPGRSS